MEKPFREGQTVVTSEDQRVGVVAGIRDECLIVETGHVFKSKHAIPQSFVHANGDELRATVSKDIIESSPKVDDETWDCHAVFLHYGLEGPFAVDPDPEGEASDEAAVQERLKTMKGEEPPSYRGPVVRERQANAADPTGASANLSDKK